MKFFLIILFTITYSIDLNECNNTKSILSPNKLIKNNDFLYGSTSGGLFTYDMKNKGFLKDNIPIFCDELVQFDQFNNEDFWFLCRNGVLYNSSNLMINHLDVNMAIDFIIHDHSIFVLYEDESAYGIMKFNFSNNDIVFEDYYQGFTYSYSEEFISISILENDLFLLTDEGIYLGDINSDLKLPSSWSFINHLGSPLDFFLNQDRLLLIFNNYLNIINKEDFSTINTIDFDLGDYIDFSIHDDSLYLLGTEKIIFLNNAIEIINEYIYDFEPAKSLLVNEDIYIGIKDQGFWALSDNQIAKCSPNTLLSNDIEAITYSDEKLYGVNRNGVFIIREDNVITNLLSDQENSSYLDETNSSECDFFNGVQLDYIPGSKISSSIALNNKKIYIPNSGILPDENSNQGGLIILDVENFIVDDIIGTSELDGLGGIYFQDIDDSYMTINQVKIDSNERLWVVNPYAEHNNEILAYYDFQEETWGHIESPDEKSYLPQEIALDQWGRIWVAFRNEPIINSNTIYSNGGVKLVTPSGVWLDVQNLESLPGDDPNVNVWSIDFGHFQGNDILWVLSSNGVQGYSISGTRIDPIYPIDFFTNIPFVKGDKIRVDAQNNVWITTSHSGVRVIKNDISFWPSEEGFTVSNSEILSNVVRDIAFNKNEGIAYLATDSGLSMLGIPFEENRSNSKVGVSPYPFIVNNFQTL